MSDDQKLLQLSDFEGLVNEAFVFSLKGVDQEIEGVLLKAEAIQSSSPRPKNAPRDPFFLEFKFPPGTRISQCLLDVKTPQGVALPPMFLVPRGEDEEGWYMDASFN